MESMGYMTNSNLSLKDIFNLAQEKQYKANLTFDSYESLAIRFGEDKSEWWQWLKIKEDQVAFDEDEDYEKLRELAPKSIIVIEYHPNTLPLLATFLKPILIKYGGFVNCRGSMEETYTLENIDMIVSGCP